jgi:hypothetical protein
MAAEIVEEVQEELVLQEGETEGNIVEETPAEVPEPEEAVEVEEPEEEVPEQYRGKSQAELAKMLQDAQQEIGYKGNELGALRKSFEQLASQQPAAPKPEPEPADDVDYFVDPQKAVNRQIDNHPTLRQAQQVVQQMQYAQGLATLQRVRHE